MYMTAPFSFVTDKVPLITLIYMYNAKVCKISVKIDNVSGLKTDTSATADPHLQLLTSTSSLHEFKILNDFSPTSVRLFGYETLEPENI